MTEPAEEQLTGRLLARGLITDNMPGNWQPLETKVAYHAGTLAGERRGR